jgi:hypothetical protein
MRKFILLGGAGLVALGAAGADAQSRPSSSPYALSSPQGTAALTEGRSAFIKENADNAEPSGGR